MKKGKRFGVKTMSILAVIISFVMMITFFSAQLVSASSFQIISNVLPISGFQNSGLLSYIIPSALLSGITNFYPRNLKVTEVKNFEGDIQIYITFDNDLAVTSYHLALRRAPVTGGTPAYVTVFDNLPYNVKAVNDYLNTGLKAGTTYSYYIDTIKQDGTIISSSEKFQIYLPMIPVLTTEALSDGTVKLSWTPDPKLPASEFSGYKILRADKANPGQADFKSIGTSNSTSFVDLSVKAGTTYTYTVMHNDTTATPLNLIIGSEHSKITAVAATSSAASSSTASSSSSQAQNQNASSILWIFVIGGVLILAIGGGLAFYLLKIKKPKV